MYAFKLYKNIQIYERRGLHKRKYVKIFSQNVHYLKNRLCGFLLDIKMNILNILIKEF